MDILGLVLAAQDLNLVWGNIGMTGATSQWSLRSPGSQNLSILTGITMSPNHQTVYPRSRDESPTL